MQLQKVRRVRTGLSDTSQNLVPVKFVKNLNQNAELSCNSGILLLF